MSLTALGLNSRKDYFQRKERKDKSDKDFELIQRCQNGDRKAQYELYQSYKDWVYNITYRMTNNKQETEDISQMVFLQVFRKIDSFRGDSAFSSWIYRITVNICINQLRKEKQRKGKTTSEPSNSQNSYAKEYSDKGDKFNIKPYLEKAIRALPEGYRMTFILHDMEGYNHKEIGIMMNIAEGTSKSQLHKARKELKSFLEPYLLLHQTF